jgi:type II secretion system protein F
MALFSYKAKDPGGQLITGTIEAESNAMVVSRLQAMGYFPVSVENQTEKRPGAAAAMRLGRRVRLADLATFNRQLSDLLNSGIPLVKALAVMQNQTANPVLVEVITSIQQDVSGGDSLAAAMSKHPRVFSKLYTAMVKSGEAGGMLDVVLARLADFAEQEAETRSKILSALAYPAVMVLVGIGAVFVMLTVVMPKILRIYGELNQALPLPTQMLLEANAFLVQYWYFLVGGLALLVFVAYRAFKSPEGRRAIDSLVVRLPVIGSIVVKQEIANFARTLGSLLHNGVSILPALEIVHGVLNNRVVADEVATIPQNVTQGEGVAAPLKKSKVFPPVVVNMMAIGEETGRLDDVLFKIARSYEMEVDRAVKTATGLIEPIIILAMGIVVGFIVISMLLPIFSIDPSAGT